MGAIALDAQESLHSIKRRQAGIERNVLDEIRKGQGFTKHGHKGHRAKRRVINRSHLIWLEEPAEDEPREKNEE